VNRNIIAKTFIRKLYSLAIKKIKRKRKKLKKEKKKKRKEVIFTKIN